MPHPDTPLQKTRTNRKPSSGHGKGPGKGAGSGPGQGPASGIPAGGDGWGGPPHAPLAPWPKGEVQPHTGRTASLREAVEAAGGSADIVKTWKAIRDDATAPHAARIAAANAMADRLEGKAPQLVGHVHADKPASELTRDQLVALLEDGPVIEGEAE